MLMNVNEPQKEMNEHICILAQQIKAIILHNNHFFLLNNQKNLSLTKSKMGIENSPRGLVHLPQTIDLTTHTVIWLPTLIIELSVVDKPKNPVGV